MKYLLAVLVFTLCANADAKRLSAKATVEDFYKKYLMHGVSRENKTHFAFSKSFHQLIHDDKKVCETNPAGEICGWDAHGNVYLDAQEYDSKLTYENSGFTAKEEKPGQVLVNMNVYPSQKK